MAIIPGSRASEQKDYTWEQKYPTRDEKALHYEHIHLLDTSQGGIQ